MAVRIALLPVEAERDLDAFLLFAWP